MIKRIYKQIEIFLIIFLISGCTFTVGTGSKKKKEKNYTYHYVRKGENLFRISKYYYNGKSVSEIKKGIEKIKKANHLSNSNIKLGQKLFIPGTYKKQPSYALTPPEEVKKIPATKTNKSGKEKFIPIIKDKAFVWPVKGKIINEYGEFGNKGIDVEVNPGSEVFATCDGTVIYTGITAKYQETIIIKHTNNLYTIYGHDMEILAKKGDEVKKGQIIARIKSGTQKKRFFHFEIRIGENSVDPLKYLP